MNDRTPRTRVTKEDWLGVARGALVEHGIDHVRIAVLADRLGVARSSFYWYFADREQLADALLEHWRATNTSSLLERCAKRAATITEATFNVFECWADPALFDVPLEFAVREWARRDDVVRQRLAEADSERIGAMAALHRRHGYPAGEALVRARVQYHSQIGMYALGVDENTDERLRMVRDYVRVFTGVDPSAAELQRFRRRVRS
jgi:AcrR family transcriptional regulator